MVVTREWGEFVYAPPAAVGGDRIVLDREEAHHLFRVRRIEPGETVFATTGAGAVYKCLVDMDHTLRVVHPLPEFGEPPLHMTLCMAMLKGDLNRDVADVATQLGVRSIIFFRSERSEGRLLPDKLIKLRKNAVASIKQCGRSRLPEIRVITNFASALQEIPAGTTLFVANPADESSGRIGGLEIPATVALLVGPEGGFTPPELEIVSEYHSKHLHLGGRRLRAETAVAAGLSFLLSQAGEFRVHR
jgi:16S rRNA (uracil1498-N3)-methyltransferase